MPAASEILLLEIVGWHERLGLRMLRELNPRWDAICARGIANLDPLPTNASGGERTLTIVTVSPYCLAPVLSLACRQRAHPDDMLWLVWSKVTTSAPP